jgi:hypothetical protein
MIEPILKYDPTCKRVRLFRIIWAQGKKCISIGLEPYFYRKDDEYFNNAKTFMGIRVDLKIAGGGRFV